MQNNDFLTLHYIFLAVYYPISFYVWLLSGVMVPLGEAKVEKPDVLKLSCQANTCRQVRGEIRSQFPLKTKSLP